jgi:hypothetical protein
MDLKTIIRAFWDRIAAWALIGVGAVLLLVGWLGVRDTPYIEEQVPYVISAGFTGLALIGIGATLWLSADLRDEWHRLRALEEGVKSLLAAADGADPEVAQSNGTARSPRRSVKQ